MEIIINANFVILLKIYNSRGSSRTFFSVFTFSSFVIVYVNIVEFRLLLLPS